MLKKNEKKVKSEKKSNPLFEITDKRHLPATEHRKQLISKKLKEWHKNNPASESTKLERSERAKRHWNELSEEEQQKIKEHLYLIRVEKPALGKTWNLSEETKIKQGNSKRGRKVSNEVKEKLSILASERIRNGANRFYSGRPSTVGTREDLGLFLRSKWEANYARYLNWLVEKKQIVKWEYEVDTFWFEKIKTGTRRYTPDFKIFNNDGSVVYHEVKGWMDPVSKTKLKRMAKYHPEVKIVIIDGDFMKDLKHSVGRLIAWE